MELAGRNIVVTGGAHGIGRALCRRFAAEGAARITTVDVDLEGAERVADEVSGRARRVDVSDRAAIESLVKEVESEDGPIDLFVSNAGIAVAGGAEVDPADWQRIWEINVMHHVWAARHMVPRWVSRGGGYLLTTASAAGLLSNLGTAPYTVTKHAAVGLAEWLSITHADDGVRVSVLCPQAVRTAMTDSDDPVVANVVAHGMIEPEAVADAVVAGLADERFLILPHPEVAEYIRRRAGQPDRWLGGMRRMRARLYDERS